MHDFTKSEKQPGKQENPFISLLMNNMYPGITLFARDVNLLPGFAEKYRAGMIIREKGFTDATIRFGGMATSHRYVILSNHMKNFAMLENGTNWGLYVANRDAHFKVLGQVTYKGKTGIFLLHLPDDETWKAYQTMEFSLEVPEENERLKEENRQLIEQMVDYENYKNENESLKEQLQIQEDNPEWETMTASVIGRDPSDQFYSFTIDKGTLDGVSYQDPVITADGLVGIVSEVGPVFAKVTTILDVRLNVACQDVRTQDVATVSGDIELAQNGQCRMSLIPRESGIAKGDIIQTAGTSGLYPQGIVIGRVSDVGYEPSGTMMYAVVEPSSDIETVKDVVIITSFKGQGSSLSSFEQDSLTGGQTADEESTADETTTDEAAAE